MKPIGILLMLLFFIRSQSWAAEKVAQKSPMNKAEEFHLKTECRKLAKKRFEEEFSGNTSSYTYANHYNRKLNSCYLLVVALGDDNIEYLYDVNEDGHKGMIAGKGNRLTCHVYDFGCDNYIKWDNLVKPYMEE